MLFLALVVVVLVLVWVLVVLVVAARPAASPQIQYAKSTTTEYEQIAYREEGMQEPQR